MHLIALFVWIAHFQLNSELNKRFVSNTLFTRLLFMRIFVVIFFSLFFFFFKFITTHKRHTYINENRCDIHKGLSQWDASKYLCVALKQNIHGFRKETKKNEAAKKKYENKSQQDWNGIFSTFKMLDAHSFGTFLFFADNHDCV